jgi:alkylresorcinol/alkylpyrone synthase
MARIARVGLAVPPRVVPQAEARRAAASIFAGLPGLEKMLSVFDRAGVERRHFCHEPEYYGRPAGLGARNDDYIANAVDLAAKACAAAEVEPREVDHLIFVTTTGLATPSVDARLAHRLGFRRDVSRTPIFGVGCAGGVVGLARGFELLRGGAPVRRALVVSVELCGQTFDPTDRSKSNVVATAIFGEGAAAVVWERGVGAGPRIVAAESLLWPDSLDVMGWDYRDGGPRLVLSKRIPDLIRSGVGGAVSAFLGRHGLRVGDVSRWIVHPGGPRVLEAVGEALGLGDGDALEPSRRLLREYGNLSSASVLFLLAETLPSLGQGEAALAMAVGPGFSLEQVLIRG